MAKRRPPEQHERTEVERIHGHRAGLAVLTRRPGDVLRVACVKGLEEEVVRALGTHTSRLGVGILAEHEIERLARSPQHEGLCLEAKARRWETPQELGDRLERSKGLVIALDRVRNSYNIGAILRTAAFFGLDAMLLGAPAPHPGLDPNAIRVAEGGAEHVALARTTDLADTLSRLRARGVRVYGADMAAPVDLATFRAERPAVIVLGNERQGLAPRIRATCDGVVALRGTGAIESLNVGVAAGILIASLMVPSKR